MTSTVYALREIGSVEVRYVGMTEQRPASRLGQHLSHSRPDYAYPLHKWIYGTGKNVEVVTISEHDEKDEARLAERDAIRLLSAIGHRLFNDHHNPVAVRTRAKSPARQRRTPTNIAEAA